MKRTYLEGFIPTLMTQQTFCTETMNEVETANDRNFVPFDSEATKTQENFKAVGSVIKNHLTTTSLAIDAPTQSLNYIDPSMCIRNTLAPRCSSFPASRTTPLNWILSTPMSELAVQPSFLTESVFVTLYLIYVPVMSQSNFVQQIWSRFFPAFGVSEVHSGSRVTPAIEIGYMATEYQVRIVL